jgi:TolB-like protein/Tfp pilus assembly protein PilF
MIVVLPFENLGDPEDEYFADGMTEEVTSRLAVVSGLRVISRTSAMQYKGNRPALTQIGEELGVDYVLEGSVRWARNNGSSRVRITPQLIRVTDDSHLWADSYDRVIEDVFAVQSDIASKVVQQLGVTLAERERDVMGEWPTDNLNAYELYSRGREAFYEYSREGNEQAAGFFQKALELDESYVLALAGLSLSQARYITAEWSEDPIWLERAEKTALRAVALGPKSAEAHFALGFAYHAGRKHSLAQSQMNRVLELNPNHAHAHDTLADSFLFGGGLPEEAIAEYEIAIRLDPLLAPANWNLAASLLAMGRLSDASAQCQRMIQSGVAPRRAHRNIGMASELRGKYEMAVKHYSAAVEAGDVESHLLLLDLLLQSGDRGDAEAVAKALKRACPEGAGCKTYQRYLDVRLALSRENKNEARELMITPAEFDVSFSFSPFVTLSERIGIAYLEVEDYDAAIRWYQYALMVCPYWKVLHYRLGQTLEVAGQREAAIKSYRTFLGWWNRADPDAMPLLDAQERLSALTKVGPQGD